MRVLITNDDGVGSRGIAALASVATELGLDVVVAAPAWDSSGASASLTGVSTDGRLLFEPTEIAGLPGAVAYAVQAAPAMIVRAGVRAARLAAFGAVQTNVTEVGAGYVTLNFAEIDPTGETDTDAALLVAGYATITPLAPVCEAADVDIDVLVASIVTRRG